MARDEVSRREALKRLSAGAAVLAAPAWLLRPESGEPLVVAGQPADMRVTKVSDVTVRITLRAAGGPSTIPFTGALTHDSFGSDAPRQSDASKLARVRSGNVVVRLTMNPPTIHVETSRGELVQRLTLAAAAPG